MVRSSAIFLTTILMGFSALGIPVEGIVDYSGNQPVLFINSQSAFKLVGQNSIVNRSLKRLKTGDYVQGEAAIDFSKRTLRLKTIDIVGLQNLLGTWESTQADLYQFRDFKNLHLYRAGQVFTPTKGQRWSYKIAPGDGSSWSIFISQKDQIFFGTIDFGNSGLEMSFFDLNGANVFHDSFRPVQSFSTW